MFAILQDWGRERDQVANCSERASEYLKAMKSSLSPFPLLSKGHWESDSVLTKSSDLANQPPAKGLFTQNRIRWLVRNQLNEADPRALVDRLVLTFRLRCGFTMSKKHNTSTSQNYTDLHSQIKSHDMSLYDLCIWVTFKVTKMDRY